MSAVPEVREAASDPLRAEHDALAARLAIRRSVDEVRKGSYLVFAGLVGTGLSVKIAWDRFGPLRPGVVRKVHAGPPILLWLAIGAAVVLLALSIRAFARARRLGREEDLLWARCRELRAALRLDA